MTKEEVEKLEPGLELDILIAEKVMGWEREDTKSETYLFENKDCFIVSKRYDKPGKSSITVYLKNGINVISNFSPSTKINNTWDVLHHLAGKKHWRFKIESQDGYDSGPLYFCTIYHAGKEYEGHSQYGEDEDQESLPLAICRACLLAVEKR